jgi:hypothetical protein
VLNKYNAAGDIIQHIHVAFIASEEERNLLCIAMIDALSKT